MLIKSSTFILALLCIVLPVQSSPLNLTLRGSWPGVPRGPAYDVTVAGNRAYVALGVNGLAIYDVTNPSRPVQLGFYATAHPAEAVKVSCDAAWVVETRFENAVSRGFIEMIDVTNPQAPVKVGEYQTERGIFDMQVINTRAYIGSEGLEIVEFATPQNPARLGRYAANSVVGIHVVGTRAHLAVGENGMEIIDVTDPANLVRLGAFETEGFTRRVHVAGNYAYLSVRHAVGNMDVQIIDVSAPNSPTAAGGYKTWSDAPLLRVSGDYAYVLWLRWSGTHNVGNLEILDVTAPTNPVPVGAAEIEAYGTSGLMGGFAVSGDHVYLAAQNGGLQILDVSDPTHPLHPETPTTSGTATDVHVVGNYAFVADGFSGLRVLDVSQSTRPNRVGGYDGGGYAKAVQVAGNHAFVGHSPGGLRIFDIHNVSNILAVGSYAPDDFVEDFQVIGNYAYLVGRIWTGSNFINFMVVDVTQPASPVQVGSLRLDGTVSALRVVGNRAYLAGTAEIDDDDFAMFHVLDVTEPANPALLSSLNIGEDEAVSLEVAGNHAYVAGYGPALRILNVSDAMNPTLVAAYGTNRYALDANVAGKFACIIGREVELVDISDPANPVGVAAFPLSVADDEDVGMHALSNRIYVAGGYSGVHVLEMTLPRIASINRSGNQVILHWSGAPGVKLQRTSSLTNPIWSDVAGSENQSTFGVPIGTNSQFFRLISP